MESAVLAFGMILFCGVIMWILDSAKKERSELQMALIARSLPEYAQSKITAKERTKMMKLENDLAIANQKILDQINANQSEERGIVV